MNQEIERRRTFAIISHPDAGKTTLTEKFLLFGGQIQVAGAVKNNKMELLFDVTSLMRLVKSVTSVYKNSTLQTISDLLNQYDKMYAGFNLVK